MGEAFMAVARGTPCPFALNANIEFARPWLSNQSFEENSEHLAADLKSFCANARQRNMHGLVLEAAVGARALSTEGAWASMRMLMTAIASRDRSASESLKSDRIECRGWQFTVDNTRLFVSLFAPCYPPGHTKHLPALDTVAIFFQPDFSFDLCGINSQDGRVKNRVRALFERAGKRYDTELIDRRIESHIYVSPLQNGDSPVRWWVADSVKEPGARLRSDNE